MTNSIDEYDYMLYLANQELDKCYDRIQKMGKMSEEADIRETKLRENLDNATVIIRQLLRAIDSGDSTLVKDEAESAREFIDLIRHSKNF
jgi:hypothetical protein